MLLSFLITVGQVIFWGTSKVININITKVCLVAYQVSTRSVTMVNMPVVLW
jgi:hypothetical protein